MIVKKNSLPNQESLDAKDDAQENRENVRAVSKSLKVDRYVWKKNKSGKAILCERGVDARDLPDDYECFDRNMLVYTLIAEAVAEGASLNEVAKKKGMPSRTTMFRWLKQDENFRAMVDAAEKYRAEHFHGKLQEVAKRVKESNAKSSKVKADVYKHLMAIGDREKYGQQTKIVGDPNQPVSFIVDTGIRRLEKNPPIPAESRVVDAELSNATTGQPTGSLQQEQPASDLDGVQSSETPERDPSEP